jgi:hypothetical protein
LKQKRQQKRSGSVGSQNNWIESGPVRVQNAGQKNRARHGAHGGKSTSGIRIQNRLSSKLTTKAAREQKRGPCAGSKKIRLRGKSVSK